MRKYFPIVLLLAAIALWFGPNWFAPRAVLSAPPQRILAIGDSLTSGVPADGGATPWPQQLAAMNGAEVLNFSHPGDTITAAIQRWEQTLRSGRLKRDDAQWRPDVIIVVLGGNDIRAGTNPSTMTAELVRLESLLQPLGAPVLFVAVPGGLLGDRFRNVWSDAANQTNQHELDQRTLRRIFTNNRYTIEDRIHFNQEGQRFFAEAINRRLLGR